MELNKRDLDELDNCLMCANNGEALEYYLSGSDSGKELCEFYDSDKTNILNIVENIIPQHFTPIASDFIGYMLLEDNHDLPHLNSRKIKCVTNATDEDTFCEDGWKYMKVCIPRGTPCYCHHDTECVFSYVFTKSPVRRV